MTSMSSWPGWARLGLVKPRTSHTLESYVDYYVEARKDVKTTTKNSWTQTKRVLIDFFGPDRDNESPRRKQRGIMADYNPIIAASGGELTPKR